MTRIMTDQMRLFVALPCPDQVNSAFKALNSAFPKVKMAPSGQTHLTLKFLGDLPEDDLPLLTETLSLVRAPGFALEFDRLGSFRIGSGLILWAGLSPSPELLLLHKSIENVLATKMNIKPDKRAFQPHVTLARLRLYDRSLAETARKRDLGHVPGFKVEDFCLFQSVLTPARAEHSLLRRFPLLL
jgi:2'-5' RNA ligase